MKSFQLDRRIGVKTKNARTYLHKKFKKDKYKYNDDDVEKKIFSTI